MLVLDQKGPRRTGPQVASAEKVFLLPGQWYFGHTGAHVKTLLGSCIAITLWHPRRKVGGMCHFLLPTRLNRAPGDLDGRFGDEAGELLMREIKRFGTRSQDYEAHLYGGADTMPDQARVKFNIGERNVEKAWEIIDHCGFQLQCVDVGGNEPRNVAIDLANGQVVLRRGQAHGNRKGA
jgi:chemotaxis protein CheD